MRILTGLSLTEDGGSVHRVSGGRVYITLQHPVEVDRVTVWHASGDNSFFDLFGMVAVTNRHWPTGLKLLLTRPGGTEEPNSARPVFVPYPAVAPGSEGYSDYLREVLRAARF